MKDIHEKCVCGHRRANHANFQLNEMCGFCYADDACRCMQFRNAETKEADDVTVLTMGARRK